jgi:hypothetical protein
VRCKMYSLWYLSGATKGACTPSNNTVLWTVSFHCKGLLLE